MQVIAAHRQTTVEALAAENLHRMAAAGLTASDALTGTKKALYDYLIGRISRNATLERLGVDDATLARMLRQAGFPPL